MGTALLWLYSFVERNITWSGVCALSADVTADLSNSVLKINIRSEKQKNCHFLKTFNISTLFCTIFIEVKP